MLKETMCAPKPITRLIMAGIKISGDNNLITFVV